MEDMRIKRGVDIASGHHLVVTETKLKLREYLTTGETALLRFNTDFRRHTDKLSESKITQQQVPTLIRSAGRSRNHYGGKRERDQRSTGVNVSRSIGQQETPL